MCSESLCSPQSGFGITLWHQNGIKMAKKTFMRLVSSVLMEAPGALALSKQYC